MKRSPEIGEAYLTKSGAGRRSLKKYEITNLFFFLGLILALGVLVTFVFRHYGNRDRDVFEEGERGIISEALYPGNDLGVFRLGTKLYQTSRQFRNPMQIPVTDDGFLKELFDIPGVEEVMVDQNSLMIRKTSSVPWESIRPGVQQVVLRHLHLHY
jgi:hypothetical protein